MYAKNLERILYLLCKNSDVSHSTPDEFSERFESLRGSALLPRGRERRESLLDNKQISAAILGLVSMRPSWAAHGAIVLADLRPVGGTGASFFDAPSLSDAVQVLLENESARKGFVRLFTTLSETGTNSNGGATIVYERDGTRRRAYFVSKMATSLFASGREATFDPESVRCNSAVAREMSFHRDFFQKMARECDLARRFSAPVDGDGSEYDAEEARQRRYEALGVTRQSRFLNVGVDTQVTWPKEELQIKFDRYSLVLMPKTKDNAQSIHIDLHANQISDAEAITVINRFLSIMAWCDDQSAVRQFGWSGNPIPVPVSRLNLGSSIAWPYPFDRKIPESEGARRALALYREARSAQQNGFISYAVLNFYKIIEIKHPNNPESWFRENFPSDPAGSCADDFKRFNELRGEMPPEKYINGFCRRAVAHASNKSESDPDKDEEVQRLHIAADIMRFLARKFIKTEFGVSDLMYSDD
jgi:hypothetical protein